MPRWVAMNSPAPSPPAAERWAVAVPAKDLARAKSRLAAAWPDQPRRALARAMLADVLAALEATAAVGAVAVVSGDPELAALARARGAEVVPEPTDLPEAHADGGGTGHGAGDRAYRAAAAAGLQWAATVSSRRAVLAADLPGATAADLDAVLTAAAASPRAFLVDEDRRGTTLATFCGVAECPTFFGPDSAAAFAASGAVALGAAGQWPGLRRDVDAHGHLQRLPGVGPHTAAVLRAVPRPVSAG